MVMTTIGATSATAIDGEIDRDVIARLSALTEAQALDWFWLLHRRGVEPLPLLLHLTQVVIARPSTWNRTDVRREHERRGSRQTLALDTRTCFACLDSQHRHYFHHIVEVQHGGSNAPRNLVPLCFRCHQYLHPWLTEEPARRRTPGFQSVYEIGRNVIRTEQP